MKYLKLIGCVLLLFILLEATNNKIAIAQTKVKSMEITTMPEKRAYNVGEGYSTKGMVVEAIMSDGSKVTIDNSNITSYSGVELTEGRAFTQEGWKSVEIKYNGVKTTFAIVVFDPLKEYYISYDSDGGSKIENKKIDASTKDFKLPTPKKKGTTFLGWYHANGQKYTKYEQGMGPSLQFKAKWGYSFIFHANGGTGEMKNGTISSEYKLPKNKFKRSGYKFVGWSTKKSADYTSFYEVGDLGSYVTNEDKNVTLYAQWVKSKSYKITYASTKNVKIDKKAITKYTAGKKTSLPWATYTGKDDKLFNGWKITINGKEYGETMVIPPYISGDIKLTPVITKFEG